MRVDAVLSPLKFACPDRIPRLSARDLLVRVLEHVGVAGEKSAAGTRPGAAFDFHHRDRIIREAAEESGQGAGGEMAAALAVAVKLGFPAILDVDHGESVVKR